jgi:hypothetical protein
MSNIRSFRELKVWQKALDVAMRVFEVAKRFPADERYSLTDRLRRSSPSVPANNPSPRLRVCASMDLCVVLATPGR